MPNSRRSAASQRGRVIPKRCLGDVHSRIMQLPNAYGTFIGYKQIDGAYSSQLALICLVAEKVDDLKLQPARRVPRRLAWSRGELRRSMRTDVVAAAAVFVSQAGRVGPGDTVSAQQERATIGVALRHPTLGTCLTTAAHLFERNSTVAAEVFPQIGSPGLSISVRVRPITDLVDYALLHGLSADACSNAIGERTLRAVYTPQTTDIGKEVFVILRDGSAIRTVCRGVHARLEPPEAVLSDCILTDMVTSGGDSGACLTDAQGRVWGLLRGRIASTYSVFAPLQYVLAKEAATLL